jgi:hypothetical protein
MGDIDDQNFHVWTVDKLTELTAEEGEKPLGDWRHWVRPLGAGGPLKKLDLRRWGNPKKSFKISVSTTTSQSTAGRSLSAVAVKVAIALQSGYSRGRCKPLPFGWATAPRRMAAILPRSLSDDRT